MPSDQSSSNAADNTANHKTGNFEDTVTDRRGSETAESEGIAFISILSYFSLRPYFHESLFLLF